MWWNFPCTPYVENGLTKVPLEFLGEILGTGGCIPASPTCPESATGGATCSSVAPGDFGKGALGAGGCIPTNPRCPESATIDAI